MVESFGELGLSEPLLRALIDVGYEAPTPIQTRTIPALLSGRDLIGQAPTGTGKTAAFALPLLERLDVSRSDVQALVLTPTRELSIQVAEAIHTYARYRGSVRAVPIYGGQSIQPQLRHLAAGVHIVVGTPGRIMDHLRRGALDFASLSMVVIDEADEMLRMGFLEDVEWILGQAPAERQTALFSATMPREVRRIAERYLRDPVSVAIEQATRTVPTVEQRYLNVSEREKLDALTRILESEPIDAALVFVRTKTGAAQVGERLQARGYAVEAMHGDMTQPQRETVIRRLRSGQLEAVVATDVAARGLDVERVSHVINYDLPGDPESYVHRIGRTARAGRPGTAVLFVTPREQRLLREIERYTGQRIQPARMPTAADVAARRTAVLKESVLKALAEGGLEAYLAIVEEIAEEGGFDMAEVAAAAARLARGDKPLDVPAEEPSAEEPSVEAPAGDGMVRLFINAGRGDGIRPADIVGAIANEAGVPGRAIGAIDIYDRFTFVEVPAEHQARVLERMAGVSIRNRRVEVRVALPGGPPRAAAGASRGAAADARADRRDRRRDERRPRRPSSPRKPRPRR
jgi:ATP-dependent RNA helicase DeaD